MRLVLWFLAAVAAAVPGVAGQPQEALPFALQQILEADRAFAVLTLESGWKAAALAYLAPGAVGFDSASANLARPQIERRPDPAPGHRRTWEARYGDSAASGELGYVAGPLQDDTGATGSSPVHFTYLRIWQRQRDQSFRVLLDLHVPTPRPGVSAQGFTRAPYSNRFTEYDDTTPPLGTADELLNAGLRSDPVRAYRQRLSSGVRFHRPNVAPLESERRVLQWLATQPAFASVNTRRSEAARSGDLGFTWGTYARAGRGTGRTGHYVRVWVRERDGQWRIAVDVLQPQ